MTLNGLTVTPYIKKKTEVDLTINFLDAQQVVHGQFKVVSVHVLVERCHDGCGVIGVFKAQCVAKLVDCYQEQIVTLKQKEEKGAEKKKESNLSLLRTTENKSAAFMSLSNRNWDHVGRALKESQVLYLLI